MMLYDNKTSPTTTKTIIWVLFQLNFFFFIFLTVVFWVIRLIVENTQKLFKRFNRKEVTITKEKVIEKITFYSIDNIDLFKQKMNDLRDAKPNSLVISHDPLVQAAYIDITGRQLNENLENIKQGYIQRDDNARRSVKPRGWFNINKKQKNSKTGKELFIYHRTHLVPFNMCLSEGEVDIDLLFTGTAQLNNGSRLQYNYQVPSEEIYKRGKSISYYINKQGYKSKNGLLLLGRDKIIYEDRKLQQYYNDLYQNERESSLSFETTYSLADIEMGCRLAMLYNGKADHLYRYGVICEYDTSKAIQTQVPSSVTVYFYDVTKKKLLLEAKIDNKI